MNWWWLLCIFILTPHFGSGQNQGRPVVVLDPGHGGTDTGAIGIDGVKEKLVVFELALEIQRLNRKLFDGRMELYLTRYGDTLISLNDRARLTKGLRADLFLSIHGNWSHDPLAKGTESYILGTGSFEYDSHNFAHQIDKTISSYLGLHSRGVKSSNFRVLVETRDLCPSVLLEIGFLSNPSEAKHFSREGGISALALAILETLMRYFHAGNI